MRSQINVLFEMLPHRSHTSVRLQRLSFFPYDEVFVVNDN